MELTDALANLGFALQDVKRGDLASYIDVKRACYKTYVEEYFGGWDENVQIKMNTEVFYDMLKETCFKKLLLNNVTVGFFAYDEGEDRIGGVSVQMLDTARNKGVGSFYLRHLAALSAKTHKPAFLKVFKSNPAQNLYKRFHFVPYEETRTHYLMRYDPAASDDDAD